MFGLVSLYQLSFTFVTSKVESDAKTYAQASVNTDDADYFTLVDIAERNYLDSIAEQKVFGVFNSATAKDRELNKGLDLKGGINVILQVSVKDILATNAPLLPTPYPCGILLDFYSFATC